MRRTGEPGTAGVPLKGKYDASQQSNRTTSQNRAVERKSPAKELGGGHGGKVVRGMLDQFALGASIGDASHLRTGAGIRDRDTGDGSNEGSQSWNERKDPHGLCFGRGGSREGKAAESAKEAEGDRGRTSVTNRH